MKFLLNRTSCNSEEVPPCEGATPIPGGGYPAWEIEVNTLEELMAFAEKHGTLVFDAKCSMADPRPRIEIYDDYRE